MVLVDLATGTLVTEPDDVATVLEPTADEAALAAAAGGNAGPIAIAFPSFTDGRGFSLARLLRERHGFKGEIRAVGYLIPDHAQFLLRSGFDTAEIADPEAARMWKASLERITRNYQPAVRNPLPLRWEASRKAALALDEKLRATDDLMARIKALGEEIEGRLAFSTSLGLEDQAIIHAIAKSGITKSGDVDVFTLDTGRLFPEVLETVELSELRFRIRIRFVSPEASEVEALVARDGVYGFRQAIENRKSCCEVRKVRPLNRALEGAQGWITGLRREHSDARADVPLAVWDAARKAALALDDVLGKTDDLVARIKEVASRIEGRIAFSTSLGMEDKVILHAIAKSGVVKSGADIDVFTLDTGRLFPEVLETVELSELRFRIRIRLVAPEAQEVEALVARDGVFGFRNAVENRKACCEVRKVRPLNRALEGAQGWLTGLRREHSDARSDVPLATWDAERGLIKVNPVADWSTEKLMDYIAANNIPVNPLHAQGIVSIGCAPCTRAIQPGENPRAGRWWWENEDSKECGLHVAEDGKEKEIAA